MTPEFQRFLVWGVLAGLLGAIIGVEGMLRTFLYAIVIDLMGAILIYWRRK
jgi:hypothetical protein